MLSTITRCLKDLSAALLYFIPHTKKAIEAIFLKKSKTRTDDQASFSRQEVI